MTWTPAARRSAGVWLLTDAWVPTGMNCGVSITPCGVWSSPRRATPTLVGRVLKAMAGWGMELQDSLERSQVRAQWDTVAGGGDACDSTIGRGCRSFP